MNNTTSENQALRAMFYHLPLKEYFAFLAAVTEDSTYNGEKQQVITDLLDEAAYVGLIDKYENGYDDLTIGDVMVSARKLFEINCRIAKDRIPLEKVRDIYGVTYEEYGEIYTEFTKALKQLLYFPYINCFTRCEDAEGKEKFDELLNRN